MIPSVSDPAASSPGSSLGGLNSRSEYYFIALARGLARRSSLACLDSTIPAQISMGITTGSSLRMACDAVFVGHCASASASASVPTSASAPASDSGLMAVSLQRRAPGDPESRDVDPPLPWSRNPVPHRQKDGREGGAAAGGRAGGRLRLHVSHVLVLCIRAVYSCCVLVLCTLAVNTCRIYVPCTRTVLAPYERRCRCSKLCRVRPSMNHSAGETPGERNPREGVGRREEEGGGGGGNGIGLRR